MNVCTCGTVHEATKVAEKMFVQIAGSDCPIWALQVGSALQMICLDHLMADAGLSGKDAAKAVTLIMAEVSKHTRPAEELAVEAATRRAELYGEEE